MDIFNKMCRMVLYGMGWFGLVWFGLVWSEVVGVAKLFPLRTHTQMM